MRNIMSLFYIFPILFNAWLKRKLLHYSAESYEEKYMCCICYILEWSGMFVWPWILANVRLETQASGAEPQTATPTLAPVAYRRLDLKSRHTPFTPKFWPQAFPTLHSL